MMQWLRNTLTVVALLAVAQPAESSVSPDTASLARRLCDRYSEAFVSVVVSDPGDAATLVARPDHVRCWKAWRTDCSRPKLTTSRYMILSRKQHGIRLGATAAGDALNDPSGDGSSTSSSGRTTVGNPVLKYRGWLWRLERPDWACKWMPTRIITLRPAAQFAIAALLYVLHLTVLTQRCVAFPVQLIPNDHGYFQSIGYDSIAGILSFVGLCLLRRQTKDAEKPAVPAVFTEPYYDELPWRSVANLRARAAALKSSARTNKLAKRKLQRIRRVYEDIVRSTTRAAFWLLVAYSRTGQFAMTMESTLYAIAGMGVPMTIAMHRSLVVLLGHLCWVGLGCAILKLELTPPFFGGQTKRREKLVSTGNLDVPRSGFDGEKNMMLMQQGGSKITLDNKVRSDRKTRWKTKWYSAEWDTYWIWWTVGGYFVSCWLFNIADVVNQFLLPSSVFEDAGEGVVSQLINPENNDLIASFVGYIAPCLSAPIWEEVLYRGYMLPALCLHMTFWPAVVVSGLIFSAHHMSSTGFIPLTVLGMTWAALYVKSRNLLVTILIHAMWNSRVFLGSWLGL